MGSGAEVNHPKHVFCVDSSQTFLHVLRAVFEQSNFTTTVQEYSPDIFDQIRISEPDVIIVDLAFGQESGWRLLERLEIEFTDRTPIVVTSTDRRILEQVRLKQANSKRSHAYLVKPLDIHGLVETASHLADGVYSS
jgi:CheY-like chemotaxis protein